LSTHFQFCLLPFSFCLTSRLRQCIRAGQYGQGKATYAGTPLTFHEGEAVPVELDGSVVGRLDVKEIFS